MTDKKSENGMIKIVVMFITWYSLCGAYNVYAGKAKKDLVLDDEPLQYFIALGQLSIGLVYAIPMWLLGTPYTSSCSPLAISVSILTPHAPNFTQHYDINIF